LEEEEELLMLVPLQEVQDKIQVLQMEQEELAAAADLLIMAEDLLLQAGALEKLYIDF
jgi:hypothetical protein